MWTRFRNIEKSLGFRVALPVLVAGGLIWFALYSFILSAATDFAAAQIRSSLAETCRDVWRICDQGLDEFMRTGQPAGSHEELLAQQAALGRIEDLCREEKATALVVERETGRVLSPAQGLSQKDRVMAAADGPGRLGSLELEGGTSHVAGVEFLPWGWGVYVVKEAAGYADLLGQVRRAYLVTGGILVLSGLLLIALLEVVVTGPVRRIVAQTMRGEDPHYRGTLEMEVLAGKIREMRASLKEKTDWLDTLLSTVSALVVVLDEGLRIHSANRTCSGAVGREPADLEGRAVWDALAPAADRDAWRAAFQDVADGVRARGFVLPLAGAGAAEEGEGAVHVLWRCSAIAAGGRKYLLATGLDVTDRLEAERGMREAQAELRVLNADLERRVRERTADLEAAYRELESFSYSLSHDLRAPLRSIDGFSLALAEDYGPLLGEDGRDYVHRVRRASQRMAELIDDLQQLAQVTRAEMGREPCDLSAMAREVLRETAARDGGRQVEILVQPNLSAECDPALVRMLLSHLLRNAWKFTSRTPHARIEFGRRESGQAGVYYVRDNGAGFDMAYAHKLFGPFGRLHSPEEYEGSGIGLAICHRVVLRHGGRIWAEGEVGRGAAFHFTLGEDRPASPA